MSQLPLYQIADWDRRFENNRSRQVDQCTFVCFRNHDVSATSAITNHYDGLAVLGVWHQLGILCSGHSKPRAGYITSDGRLNGWRLGSEELGHMWHVPAAAIRRAFAVLSSRQVGLINLIDGIPESAISAFQVTPEVTPENVSRSETSLEASVPVTPENVSRSEMEDVNERRKEGMKEPSFGSQREPETDFHRDPSLKREEETPQIPNETEFLSDQNFDRARQWINSLFGRQRPWAYEEMELLSSLLPISREDRALLSWAYTLPRDAEGWAIVDGDKLSKPKQSSLVLLREFSGEVDKWKSVRANLNGAEEFEAPQGDGWTEERKQVCREDFPSFETWPERFDLVPIDMQRQIDRRARELVK
jgi:hypothetical protein